jgi:hypothetical protein
VRRVGDASYSIASRKIFDQRVANLEKCCDCKGKGAAKRLDHLIVNARLFVRRSDSFREGPGGLVSHHHTRGSRAVSLAGAAVVNTIGPFGQLERGEGLIPRR